MTVVGTIVENCKIPKTTQMKRLKNINVWAKLNLEITRLARYKGNFQKINN